MTLTAFIAPYFVIFLMNAIANVEKKDELERERLVRENAMDEMTRLAIEKIDYAGRINAGQKYEVRCRYVGSAGSADEIYNYGFEWVDMSITTDRISWTDSIGRVYVVNMADCNVMIDNGLFLEVSTPRNSIVYKFREKELREYMEAICENESIAKDRRSHELDSIRQIAVEGTTPGIKTSDGRLCFVAAKLLYCPEISGYSYMVDDSINTTVESFVCQFPRTFEFIIEGEKHVLDINDFEATVSYPYGVILIIRPNDMDVGFGFKGDPDDVLAFASAIENLQYSDR